MFRILLNDGKDTRRDDSVCATEIMVNFYIIVNMLFLRDELGADLAELG
jgi:hypothetical protein